MSPAESSPVAWVPVFVASNVIVSRGCPLDVHGVWSISRSRTAGCWAEAVGEPARHVASVANVRHARAQPRRPIGGIVAAGVSAAEKV